MTRFITRLMSRQALPYMLILLTSLGFYAACAPPIEESADAGSLPQTDAALQQDAAMPAAADVLAGIWVQTLQSYPYMRVIWSMNPAGWGNIDVRGSASGSWCRNYVDWEIVSETSSSEFVYRYTFSQQSCGESQQGDSLSVTVLDQISADPLTLHSDWGGDATMQLCGRDFSLSDPCGEGDDLGVPSSSP